MARSSPAAAAAVPAVAVAPPLAACSACIRPSCQCPCCRRCCSTPPPPPPPPPLRPLCCSLNPALPSLKDEEGNDVQFRRTLLNKCQEEFEAGVTAMKVCVWGVTHPGLCAAGCERA